MGCTGSTAESRLSTSLNPLQSLKTTTASSAKSAGTPQGGLRLLEEYSVGQAIGEGAFGVVSSCRRRSTGEEFAVKMVDKVETPADAIKKEAEMLQSMDHPNIVKVHGVYHERCFVCIVMDKYSGGDLVEGLQKHLKEQGQINCHDIVHVSRQMGAGIQYLHNRTVAHRDIKGDNYLMDRKDITDAKCKVVLTDFGTACTVGPDERLTVGVGTKIFWSPEFFDRSYGLKVDIWAMGVVMYGLVSGRFPFKDESDVRTKEVKIPKRVYHVCEEYIKKMLDKVEATRPSADAVMAHPWIANSSRRQAGLEEGSREFEEVSGNLKEDTVNDGIKERRQELIQRLNQEDELQRKGTGASFRNDARILEQKQFVLADKHIRGLKTSYEWWSFEKAKAAMLLDPCGEVRPSRDTGRIEDGYLDMFSRMLRDHNIDPSRFGQGKAKKLDQLAGEVLGGAARLMLDATSHKKLVRVVDIVLLRLRTNDAQRRLLVETAECYPDGRKRETMRLPGTKKEPYENMRQVAERVVEEFLNLPGGAVKLDLRYVERHEEETESPSYPGVRTVYRRETVEGVLDLRDASELDRIGLPTYAAWNASDKVGNTKFFQWMTDDMAVSKKVKLKVGGAEAISTLVRAPIGMAEGPLRDCLVADGVDVSKFGKGGCKTLRELSAELIRGEATLVTDPGTQKLLRRVDVLLLVIKNPASGEVLAQTEQVDGHGTRTRLDRLPGVKCRPGENHFLGARRILRRQLDIDENAVVLQRDTVLIEERRGTPAYPGLPTVYMKRLITAELKRSA